MIRFEQKWRANVAGKPSTIYRASFDGGQPAQVAYLACMAAVYAATQTIRDKAADIVFNRYHVPQKNQTAQAWALGDWVQKNIRYILESPERFITPIQLLRLGYDDCDGHAALLASLCKSIGILPRLTALAWGPKNLLGTPGYRHIFASALVPIGGRMRWMPLDSTLSEPIGTNPLPRAIRKYGEVWVFSLPVGD